MVINHHPLQLLERRSRIAYRLIEREPSSPDWGIGNITSGSEDTCAHWNGNISSTYSWDWRGKGQLDEEGNWWNWRNNILRFVHPYNV